jgi:hypothetical protein
MAQQRRNVRRSVPNQDIVRTLNQRAWYELPYWARDWLAGSAGWITLVFVVLLAPVAVLAIVLGAHSLPLEFAGVAAQDTGLGWNAIIFMVVFLLLAFAVRPLIHMKRYGWYLVITAAILHFLQSIILSHAISGLFLTIAPLYIYTQVRQRFK